MHKWGLQQGVFGGVGATTHSPTTTGNRRCLYSHFSHSSFPFLVGKARQRTYMPRCINSALNARPIRTYLYRDFKMKGSTGLR